MQRRGRPSKVGVTSCETNEEVAFSRSFISLPFTYDAELDRGALRWTAPKPQRPAVDTDARVDAVERLGSITGQGRHAAAHYSIKADNLRFKSWDGRGAADTDVESRQGWTWSNGVAA